MVIGNEVVEVYEEVEKLVDGNFATTQAPKKAFNWKDAGSYLLDFIVGVFQPLVPAMAVVGALLLPKECQGEDPVFLWLKRQIIHFLRKHIKSKKTKKYSKKFIF